VSAAATLLKPRQPPRRISLAYERTEERPGCRKTVYRVRGHRGYRVVHSAALGRATAWWGEVLTGGTWQPLGFCPHARRWPRHKRRSGAEADVAAAIVGTGEGPAGSRRGKLSLNSRLSTLDSRLSTPLTPSP
jgi:hypothetical protein